MDIKANHYKEKTPTETVTQLKSKLEQMKIAVEEIVPYQSNIDTNSLRVVFKGTNIGANGKGINTEYCKASAYAELFERFQNDYLNIYAYDKNDDCEFSRCPDEKRLSAMEIVEQNDPYMNYYFKLRNLENGTNEQKAKAFASINCPDEEGLYLCLPFYDIKNSTVQYLPSNLYSITYGSNGMSAGNTPCEAIVQGLSEIIERIVQKKLISTPQSLPTIPDEYIQKYDYVYRRYKKAQNISGIKVIMKDCSLGGQYPVAGLLIIEENTGRFGMKLGCHPDYGVAMERTLTEATQGSDITEYAKRSYIDFSNKSVLNKNNIMNSFATGLAQYPYQILKEDKNMQFYKFDQPTCFNNKVLMKRLISQIMQHGYEILIRDVSWLGFPSYHIIVPGLSEITEMTDSYIRVHNTIQYLKTLFKNPIHITETDCHYIIATINYFKGNLLLDSIKHFLPNAGIGVPYGTGALATRYLAALCDVYCGNYEGALKKFRLSEQSTMINNLNDQEKRRYTAECMYLQAFIELKSHEKVMSYLKELLDDKLFLLIDNIYNKPKEILSKVYCFDQTDTENEEIKIMSDITYKLRHEMNKVFVDQKALSRVFL